MKTIVHQTYRTTGVEPWISRCMESVRAWAADRGYEYRFFDDSMCDYAGEEYCRRVGKNMLAITDLTRLEMAREALGQGYERTVWVDADVIVCDPARFIIPLETGYAFCREAWVIRSPDDRIRVKMGVNNCVTVFTRDAVDLDFLIQTIRHIVFTRTMPSNLQIGTWLLSGLSKPLGFRLLTHVGLFSPQVVESISSGDPRMLRAQATAFGHRIAAANLTRSLGSEDACARALDVLLDTRGDIVNRHLPPARGRAATGNLPLI